MTSIYLSQETYSSKISKHFVPQPSNIPLSFSPPLALTKPCSCTSWHEVSQHRPDLNQFPIKQRHRGKENKQSGKRARLMRTEQWGTERQLDLLTTPRSTWRKETEVHLQILNQDGCYVECFQTTSQGNKEVILGRNIHHTTV